MSISSPTYISAVSNQDLSLDYDFIKKQELNHIVEIIPTIKDANSKSVIISMYEKIRIQSNVTLAEIRYILDSAGTAKMTEPAPYSLRHGPCIGSDGFSSEPKETYAHFLNAPLP